LEAVGEEAFIADLLGAVELDVGEVGGGVVHYFAEGRSGEVVLDGDYGAGGVGEDRATVYDHVHAFSVEFGCGGIFACGAGELCSRWI